MAAYVLYWEYMKFFHRRQGLWNVAYLEQGSRYLPPLLYIWDLRVSGLPFIFSNLLNCIRLNHFINILNRDICEILYVASPVYRTMCRQDRTASLIYRILLPLRFVFLDMMVSPKCSSSRRAVLELSSKLFYFLG